MVIEKLRQLLQNCGKSLRASDFKALIDFITQLGGDNKPGGGNSYIIIENGGKNGNIIFSGIHTINEGSVINEGDYIVLGDTAQWVFYKPDSWPVPVDFNSSVKINMKGLNGQPLEIFRDDFYWNGSFTVLIWNPEKKVSEGAEQNVIAHWEKIVIKASDFNQRNVKNSFGTGTQDVINQYLASTELLRKDGSIKIDGSTKADPTTGRYQYQEMFSRSQDFPFLSKDSLITKQMLYDWFALEDLQALRAGTGIEIISDVPDPDDPAQSLVDIIGLKLGSIVPQPVLTTEVAPNLSEWVVDGTTRTLTVETGTNLSVSSSWSWTGGYLEGRGAEVSVSTSYGDTVELPVENTDTDLIVNGTISTDTTIEVTLSLTTDKAVVVGRGGILTEDAVNSTATAKDVIRFLPGMYYGTIVYPKDVIESNLIGESVIGSGTRVLNEDSFIQNISVQTDNSTNQYFFFAHPTSLIAPDRFIFGDINVNIDGVFENTSVMFTNNQGFEQDYTLWVTKDANAFSKKTSVGFFKV